MSKEKDITSSPETINYRIHQRGGEVVLAACDSELVGNTWSEGVKRLSAPVSFYTDLVCDDYTILSELMKGCSQANLIGDRVIDHFIKTGYIEPNSVITVEGVPHALCVRML